jgi:hypothetical protein
VLWLVGLFVLLIFLVVMWYIGYRSREVRPAIVSFHTQRMSLQEAFFATASRSGKPRGLRWKQCEWGDMVEVARDKRTGQLFAFVAVTISFEAIEGSDMDGLAAVGNLRNASALFFHQHGTWHTNGQAIFNLNPDEAIVHHSATLERVVMENEERQS